ncbi:hypothetical protein ACHQM5_017791 [Ranunculus cassubicifolius]
MLFGKEIVDSYDNGFEGSASERQIFEGIFYGGDGGATKRRCFSSGATCIEAVENQHTNVLMCSNSENSVTTCQSSTKDSYVEDSCTVNTGFVNVENEERVCREILGSNCPPEGPWWGHPNIPDMNDENMNCSVEKSSDLSNRCSSGCFPDEENAPFQVESVDKVTPGIPDVNLCNDNHILRCNLVESSTQGIISSFYLLERHRKAYRRGRTVEKASKGRALALLKEDRKDVSQPTTIKSSVSEQCTASLLDDGALITHISGAIKGDHGSSEDSVLLNTDIVDVNRKMYCKKDPRPRLRHHVNELFVGTGWTLEKRKRNGRNYQENVYISPKGKSFYELHKAWRAIGEILFAGKSKSTLKLMQEENARQWQNIKELWSDLAETLTYIENEMQYVEASLALTRQWTLLDPFVTKVLIDRQLGGLKEGRTARSVGTQLFDKRMRRDVLAAKSVNKHKKLKRLSGSESFFDSRLPSFELDNTSLQVDTHHHGTRFAAKNVETMVDRSQLICKEGYSNGSSQILSLESEGLVRSLKDELLSRREHRRVRGETERVDAAGDGYMATLRNQLKSSNCGSLQADGSSGAVPQEGNSLSDIAIAYGDADLELVGSANVLPLENGSISLASIGDQSEEADLVLHVQNKVSNGVIKYEERLPQESMFCSIAEIVNGKMIGYPEESSCKESSPNTTVAKTGMEETIATLKNVKAKKAKKKCKKISEIKLTSIYKEKLNPSTPESDECGISRNVKTHCLKGKRERSSPVDKINSNKCDKSVSLSSMRHQMIKQSNCKKFLEQPSDSEEFTAIGSDEKTPKKSSCLNGASEVSLHKNNVPLENPSCRMTTKSKKSLAGKQNGRNKIPGCQIEDDDFLIAALILNKDFSSNSKQSTRKPYKKKAGRKLKSRKGSCKLLPRSLGTNGKFSAGGSRTVLSWLVDVGAVSVNDVLQYRNPKDQRVVKDGWVTKEGVLCRCCNIILSVSEFKVHAGFKLQRPCSNLFIESGKPYTLCQLQAWSAEYKSRKTGREELEGKVDQNDDTCGHCGDGGELVCCDNCPSTFHPTCLSEKEVPEGDWYCSSCICQICGDVVTKKEKSSSSIFLKCSQCNHKYHSTCITEGDTRKGLASDTWFCGERCQEVYSGLHSRVGASNLIADGYTWILLRSNHGYTKVHSAQRFALTAECNSKLAVALTIMEECFVPMVDPTTGINMIPQALYSWGSDFARLNFEGFYTALLEKGDELISVATIRVHGSTVAEMPLVATRSENRRQGMCRRLIYGIEDMLRSLKVEKLVVSAIPSLVDTWTSGFGFKAMEDGEKEISFKNINFMTFPGTITLCKTLYEKEAGPNDASGEENISSSEDPGSPVFGGSKHEENTIQQEEDETENTPLMDIIRTSLL